MASLYRASNRSSLDDAYSGLYSNLALTSRNYSVRTATSILVHRALSLQKTKMLLDGW